MFIVGPNALRSDRKDIYVTRRCGLSTCERSEYDKSGRDGCDIHGSTPELLEHVAVQGGETLDQPTCGVRSVQPDESRSAHVPALGDAELDQPATYFTGLGLNASRQLGDLAQ
jgi:hypothetical protein